jgi:Ca2+-binding EF-hand superfamily protein
VTYFDQDGNGTINRAEWATWNGASELYRKPVTLSENSDFTFQLADTNRDGFLTAVEIKQFMLNFGGGDIPLADLEMAVVYFDSNGDGKLNKAEWARWIDQGALVQKQAVNLVA